MERLHGFVIGSDFNPRGKTVWKVRAKDKGPYHRQKFRVATFGEEFPMRQGLNVSFVPAEMDGEYGTIFYALDVRLKNPDAKPQR